MKQHKFGHVKIPFKRIHLELTNVCDFNCLFCPKPFMKRSYGYMETELAKRAISEIAQLGLAEKITFHVMGEPTFHPDLLDILDHAASEGLPVGLTTNGGSLGRPIGQSLLDYPVQQVDVSLQTPDKGTFELRKSGKLTFEEYLDGILGFFAGFHSRHKESIFKFRFLNTIFPCKSMEEKTGSIRVMSSTKELRSVFTDWVERIYNIMDVGPAQRDKAIQRINKLVAYKWNVVEILPNVFFETYILADWGHAFHDKPAREAWAGFCFGMRDHFAVLQNGDVTLCCVDFDGRTALGNLHDASLKEILEGDDLGRIMKGFRRFQLVHPFCKHCLGGKDFVSWLTKPMTTILGLYALKPYFYKTTRLYD